jgi:hypothetical protein
LIGKRTGRSTSQVGGLLRGFEPEAHAALPEGRRTLAKQRVEMKNKRQEKDPQITYNINGPNGPSSRININSVDNSSNIVAGPEMFQQIKTEIARQISDEPSGRELMHCLESMQRATSRKTAGEWYSKFALLVENSAKLGTTLCTYLPPLAHWVSSVHF